MRISDWSSDVCSSDLPESVEATHRQSPSCRVLEQHLVDCVLRTRQGSECAELCRRVGGDRERVAGLDRKSVVQGTSVSVRVGLGGRRMIKTKNYTYITDSL